jgi:hypothetical protein
MHPLLRDLPLEGLLRIDAALEGDWSPTVVTVWTPGEEEPDLSRVPSPHPAHRHSLELYFDGAWVGIHCFKRIGEENVFDGEMARALVREVRVRLEEGASG